MAAFYGSSAIVMRELKIRWNKNFRSLLLPEAALNCLAIAAGGLSSGSSWLFLHEFNSDARYVTRRHSRDCWNLCVET